MEIEDPQTNEFVPLLGVSNFEYKPLAHLRLPDEVSFIVDWTNEGEGQEILREHMRSNTFLRIRDKGQQYQGIFKAGGWDINTSRDMIIVQVVPNG